MATSAAALRSKLFTAGPAVTAPANTEGLRQATDALLKKQANAEATVDLYRAKLGEAQQAVAKLQGAYVEQVQLNGRLQAKVKNDHEALIKLQTAVNATAAAYIRLNTEREALAAELAAAEEQRAALAGAFAAKAAAQASLEQALAAACEAGKGLQGRLDAAAAVHATMTTDLAAARAEAADKGKELTAAERRAAQLGADLVAVRKERDGLTAQLATTAAQLEQAKQDLAAKATLLEEEQSAKTKLETAVEEQKAAEEQLTTELASVKEAAKAAEAEAAAALEAKEAELQAAATQHAQTIETKQAELAGLDQAKEELQTQLADKVSAFEELEARFSKLEEDTGATQAESSSKLKTMEEQLAALRQQHDKAMKEAEARHKKEMEQATLRTAKAGGERQTDGMAPVCMDPVHRSSPSSLPLQNLDKEKEEQRKLHSELAEQKKAVAAAEAETEKFKKVIAKLEATREEMSASATEATQKAAQDAAAAEERLAEVQRQLEEERRKIEEGAAREKAAAEALAAAEQATKEAQERAAQRAAKIEEVEAALKAKEEEAKKLDTQHATDLHKLDMANESLRKAHEKLASAEAEHGQLSKAISVKEQALADKAAELAAAQEHIEALEADLNKKNNMLMGISHVAAKAGSTEAPAGGGSAGRGEGHGQPAAGGLHRGGGGAARPAKKVSILEPADLAATSEDEASSDEEGPLHEPNPHQALVPAGGAATKKQERRGGRPASQRPTAAPLPAAAPSRPIITEVDSGDEAEEAPQRPSQRAASQRRAAAAATAAVQQQQRQELDDSEEEEERQARGRKRSGRSAASKQAASKKARGGATVSGTRGLFSMQTASQGVSADQTAKGARSGKGMGATAATGFARKVVVGGGFKGKNKAGGGGATCCQNPVPTMGSPAAKALQCATTLSSLPDDLLKLILSVVPDDQSVFLGLGGAGQFGSLKLSSRLSLSHDIYGAIQWPPKTFELLAHGAALEELYVDVDCLPDRTIVSDKLAELIRQASLDVIMVLPHLRQLELNGALLTELLSSAIVSLAHITDVRLTGLFMDTRSDSFWAPLAQLGARLSCLGLLLAPEQLAPWDVQEDEQEQLEERRLPAGLLGLTAVGCLDLQLDFFDKSRLVGLDRMPLQWLMSTDATPAGVWRCTQLTELHCGGDLLALPPAGLTVLSPLRSLELGWRQFSSSFPTVLCGLSLLTELRIEMCSFGGPAVLPPQISQLSALQRLAIHDTTICEFQLAASVAPLGPPTGLTSLELSMCGLTSLPSGPYLHGLLELSIDANAFQPRRASMPAAVLLAAQLTSLRISLDAEAAALEAQWPQVETLGVSFLKGGTAPQPCMYGSVLPNAAALARLQQLKEASMPGRVFMRDIGRPAMQQADLAHLQQLSEEQLAAVTAPLGTVRVVAGPGSGKTRVLTHRIAHLIHAHGAQPWQVLAITFTNKAANEMKERLAGMLGAAAAAQLFAGTFHSLCYRLLKRHIGELEGCGRTQAFTVFDQDMSCRLLAQLVRAEHKDWKGRDVSEKAGQLQHAISGAKNSMLTWHAPSAQAAERLVEQHLVRQRGSEELSAAEELQERELVTWFGRYEQALRQNNALDFDDLLGQTVALLRTAPAVRERYLRQFRHVCVDEFQDTNTSQYELVKLLTLPRADLFVVGDPDQSIYGWRGADMTNMTHAFGKDYPQAQIHALRDNYRSCARIVATAERVIAANDDWERAGLRPKRPAGHPIEVHMLRDSYDEARHIASEIQQALRSGEHPEEQIAVLFRTHIQARLVEQELVLRNIPYVLVGGVPFWRRVEIQDVMAYLRLAVSLRDDVALARIINTPRRGLGDTSIEKLHAAAAAQGVTLSALLFGGAAAVGGGSAGLPQLPDRKELGLTPKAAAALEAFRELMLGLHGAVASQPLGRALKAIIDKTGYEKHVQDGGCSSSSKEGDEQERLQRLGQLLSAADEYEPGKLSGAAALDAAFDGPAASARVQAAAAAAAGVAASAVAAGGSAGGTPLQRAQNFLDEAALYSAVDEGGEGARGVRLMTMHAAKGLEFELVFIPGCNDGLVPLIRGNSDSSTLSEERRLFYVSLTRAKQRLRLSHTRESNHYGASSGSAQEPSRFLMDVVRAGHAVWIVCLTIASPL
ncbi:ATP-dependent DNA helicase isoform B [Chlorella sorokiniana]|uniref:DNA 3'-5' helicase n=1 Tax=Chlorella sorokiniana TaxID=3076 RepID=A0A2P6TC38_CHLSO|nr:ATP-dependent DNA helicase isoform B [Chlorella sorokiniana]|eukprot:PRW20204.1 ATP-dependent DNA helicase isoform B [Chlorella sorokiniana]